MGAKLAWPSKRNLVTWIANFQQRLNQLDEWQGNPMEIPKVTWLSGLVNPQSFLTAINQVAAQKDKLELDKLVSFSEVLKKMTPEEVEPRARGRVHQRPRDAGRAMGHERVERREVAPE